MSHALEMIPSAMCRRLDAHLNRTHCNALLTLSWFMGSGIDDYAEFLRGRLVSGRTEAF
jgi:hypothetical protein